jgi:hypothetical protein
VGHCTSNLHRIGALLQAHDLAALQGPHMSKLGGEIFPGSFRPAAVGPQGDDAVAGLEELGAHGDEVLVVLEETAKEVAEYVVEANVDTAVRKASTTSQRTSGASTCRMMSGLPRAS